MSVADARNNEQAEADIAAVVGLSLARVRRQLATVHGRTQVANCFSKQWPSDDYSSLTVKEARDSDRAPDIAKFLGVSTAAVRRRLIATHGRMLVMNCFEDEWPSLFEVDQLAELNVKDALEMGLVEDIAEITGLGEPQVRSRLDDTHGRTGLAKCFEDCWPADGETPDHDSLSECTVAAARARGLEPAIAQLLGRSESTVKRRLESTHGRTKLSKCFEAEWPRALEPDELAAITVKQAIERDLVVAIADVTGLSVAKVRRRMLAEHGRTQVANCFQDCWPDDASEGLSPDDLAEMNVADTRHRDVVADLAELTGLSKPAVKRRIEGTHGRTFLKNLFVDVWPQPPDAESLGTMTVKQARDQALEQNIADLTRLTVRTVRRRLEAEHGRTLLANCFEESWPGDEEDVSIEELAELSVGEARALVGPIAAATGLSEMVVRRRLNDAHGRLALPKCFNDVWPQPPEAVELATYTVKGILADGLIPTVADLTGMSAGGVRARLRRVHGRTLVTTCFEDCWPSSARAPSSRRDAALKAWQTRRKRQSTYDQRETEATSLTPEAVIAPDPAQSLRLGSSAFRQIPVTEPPAELSSTEAPTVPRPMPQRVAVDPRPEILFNRWQLVRRLAGGGMAEAFEVNDPETGGRLFLKRVRTAAHQPNAALLREQQIYERLSRLGCGGVLEVVEFVREDDYIGLITEFADGGDLAECVKQAEGGCLGPPRAREVALQVATTLAELHEHGIVHRDLKPENVMLAGSQWKLGDFGISKSLSRLHTQHTFQQAGTHGYAPPEQFDGVEAHTSADVYALGKLIAFMLTGQTDPDRIPQAPWRSLAQQCTHYDSPQRPTIDHVCQRLRGLQV